MKPEKINKKAVQALLAVLFAFGIIFPSSSFGLNGADVAIFNDTGYQDGGAWTEGLAAIKSMLDSYGYSYEEITPSDLNTTADLNSLYGIIMFGGGWAGGYNTYVDHLGFQNLRSFVSNGGSYFGICAGAYFASSVVIWKTDFQTLPAIYNYPADLFNGIGKGPVLDIIPWNGPTGCDSVITEGAAMTVVNIDTSVVPGIPSQLDILYYGGPTFIAWPVVQQDDEYSVIATYSLPGTILDGTSAMILFPYGSGKVFLSGPHPEVSFSNCTLYYDQTNWEFMNAILSQLLTD